MTLGAKEREKGAENQLRSNSVLTVMDGDIGRLDVPAERVQKEVTGHHVRFARAKGMDHGNALAKEVELTSLMTQQKVIKVAKVKVAVSSVRRSGDQARAEKECRHSMNGREPIRLGLSHQDL